MFYVYILYCHKDKRLYVGQTNNIEERLKRHALGHVEATKHRLPITYLYSEQYATRSEAMIREKYFKSLWSSRFKKKLKETFESKLENK